MATRATYAFQSVYLSTVTCYIHHDGYESGAAAYFRAALLNTNTRGGLVCQFIRANERAEITESHRAHGDTEYRYTVDMDAENKLTVEARTSWGEPASWRVIYVGHLLNFVNKHFPEDTLVHHRGLYYTKSTLLLAMVNPLNMASHWMERGMTGNASSSAHDAWNMIRSFQAAYGTDENIERALETIEKLDRLLCVAYGWPANYGDDVEAAYAAWRKQFRYPLAA